VVVALGSAVLAAQEGPPPQGAQAPPADARPQARGTPQRNPDVQVSTWVSRTALWVGDPVDYVVELTTAPTIDVLGEDLAQDKLKLDGLVILSADREREPRGDGSSVHRFRFRLTTYTIAPQALRISPSTVRYYVLRVGERPEDARPSGEVRVPGAVLARRSTMPDELISLALRDRGTLTETPAGVGAAGVVGLGLMLASAGPIAVWSAARIRESRKRVRRPSVRVARSHVRAALEELRGLDVASPGDRLDAYGRLEGALRRHLAESHAIPAHALSARELAARLEAADPGRPAGGIVEIVAECERARYGSPDRLPGPDRFSSALSAAERIVEEARR
jgi:hypothetical protein